MTEGISKEYQQGYEQGINDLADRLKTYYNHLTVGSFPYLIAYHIEEIKKELLKEKDND
jgi:hypothetical protein